MGDAPAQAPVKAELQERSAGLVPGGDEEIEAGEEDQDLAEYRRSEGRHGFDAHALVDRDGQAFAAGQLAKLIAHTLQGFERTLEFGKLELEVGPELRQAGEPEVERRSKDELQTGRSQ